MEILLDRGILLTVGFYADWVAGAKASCPEDAAGGEGAEGCC